MSLIVVAAIVALVALVMAMREAPMESKNPFDVVRSMMEDNLTKVASATRNYLDLLQKSMLGAPNAKKDQIEAFRAYMEPQMAARGRTTDFSAGSFAATSFKLPSSDKACNPSSFPRVL